MSVHSHPFGPLRLSGEDAVAFRRQLRDQQPSPVVQEAARRGQAMFRQFQRDGYVLVMPRRKHAAG